MEDYLVTAIVLLLISVGGMVYLGVTAFFDVGISITRELFLWWLLQSSASLLSGILGGYFLGVHRNRKNTPNSQSTSQDSSAQV